MKLIKTPKRPKSTASIEVLQRWLHKVDAIKRENAKRIQEEKKRKALFEQVKRTKVA